MMFWLLIVALFMTDGTKTVQVKIEPTKEQCIADASKLFAALKADPVDGLANAAAECHGPLDDLGVPKTNA